jgi:hypothetical protein
MVSKIVWCKRWFQNLKQTTSPTNVRNTKTTKPLKSTTKPLRFVVWDFQFWVEGSKLKIIFSFVLLHFFPLMLSFCWCFSQWCFSSCWCFMPMLKVLFFTLVFHASVGGLQSSHYGYGCCFSSSCVIGHHY